LEIAAAQDCATVASIATRVAKRSARIEFVDTGPGLPILRGKIERVSGANSGVSVELTVVQPTGQTARRKLIAPTCEQGAEALALLITLTLDPVVAQSANPETFTDISKLKVTPEPKTVLSNRSPQNAATSPPPPTRSEAVPLDLGPSPPKPADQAPKEIPEPTEDRASAQETMETTGKTITPPQSVKVRASLGPWGAGMTGPTPHIMLGFGLYGFLAFDRTSPLSLAFFLMASHHWGERYAAPGGTADFTMDAVNLDACVFHLTMGPVISRLCAAGQLGRLSASGSNTFDAESHKRFFASAGGAALLQVLLPAEFELAGEFGLGLALTRHDFAFNPHVFYQTSPQVLRFGFGVGRRW
jgi:hypothetical protein